MRVADSVAQHPFHKCQGEVDTDARQQREQQGHLSNSSRVEFSIRELGLDTRPEPPHGCNIGYIWELGPASAAIEHATHPTKTISDHGVRVTRGKRAHSRERTECHMAMVTLVASHTPDLTFIILNIYLWSQRS